MKNIRLSLAALIFAIGLTCGADDSLKVKLGEGTSLDLIRAPAGTFTQGSSTREADRNPDETQRTVTLTQAFYMSRTPITRGQFQSFVRETNYRTEAESDHTGGYGWDGSKLEQKPSYTWRNPGFAQEDTHPVCLVTWFDAKKFTDWLSTKTQRRFRLPTEAEWEYTARAGSIANEWPGQVVNDVTCFLPGRKGQTQAVANLIANNWGFTDHCGNVWQWCEDWFAPYEPRSMTDPLQQNSALSDKPSRVLRGGSFLRPASGCRIATRFRNDPRSRNADYGFRVVTLDPVVSPKALSK